MAVHGWELWTTGPQTGPSCWSGLAVLWVCPGCASVLLLTSLTLPSSAGCGAGGSPRPAPQGRGQDLSPLVGEGWGEPTAGLLLVEATEAQASSSCRAGRPGPAPPSLRPQAAVSPGSLCLYPTPCLPCVCKEGCTACSGSRWCGAHEEGAGLGFTQAQTLSPPGCWGPGKSGDLRTSGSSSGH